MANEELIKFLIQEIIEEKELLRGILNETMTRALSKEDLEYVLENFDDFEVEKLKPIFQRNLSMQTDCLLRIFVAFNQPTKLIIVINGKGAYLNQGLDLKENCCYVFDIPVKPNDAINLMADFDDSQFKTIKCLFIRFFEVR